MIGQISALAALLPLVSAHGFINDPPARRPGDAYQAACGQQPFSQQSSDINGNVQGIMQVVGEDVTEDCKLWLCKGFQFDDNTENVQSFSLGQTIDFDIDIAAPHTGFANVSIVRTATDEMIGVPLIEFENYASNAGVDANNTAFNVTMPDSIDGCSEPGECVLQWFWDAPDIDQTYESCVDFVVGSGNGGGQEPQPAPTSTAVSTPGPTSSASVPEQTSSAGTPEPTNVTPPPADDDEEEEEDDCEEIPDDAENVPEDDDEDAVEPIDVGDEDEDDCEEIPDDAEDLPEDDEDPVEPIDEDDDDCEEIPDDAEDLPEDDEDGNVEPIEEDDDCEEIPEDAPELATRDEDNCEETETLPVGDNKDSNIDFDAGGDFVEEFPSVAPGPILITLEPEEPVATSAPAASSTLAPAPSPAPGNGDGEDGNVGGGNGNGNGNGNAPGPAATVTVTVTAAADPTVVTVTVTPSPSICIDFSDLFQ